MSFQITALIVTLAIALPAAAARGDGAEYGPSRGDRLMPARFIQRVNTAGGTAAASGCSAATDAGRKALVPYTTDYIFYR